MSNKDKVVMDEGDETVLTITCPECDGAITELGEGTEAKFCPHCGEDISEYLSEHGQVVEPAIKATMLGLPVVTQDGDGSAGSISEALSRASEDEEGVGSTLLGVTVEPPSEAIVVELKRRKEPKTEEPEAAEPSVAIDDPKLEEDVVRMGGKESGERPDISEMPTVQKIVRRPSPEPTKKPLGSNDDMSHKWVQRGRKGTVAVVLILGFLSFICWFFWCYILPTL